MRGRSAAGSYAFLKMEIRSVPFGSAPGARDVAARYDADPAARRLFDVYGEELAQFAGPVLTRFNADVLVLGGNISRAYPLFGPALERRFAADGIRVAVRTSALLDHAAMIGAASLFL